MSVPSVTRRAAVAATASALAAPAFAQPRRPLRILILGGTGFTGPHQIRYALARGHHVTVFNRGRRSAGVPAAVEQLSGDRNTGDLKALAGRQWDVCIDNPTTLPFWVRDAHEALKAAVGHYVFISTISVYASNATPGADERAAVAPYTGPDPMAEKNPVAPNLYGPLKALSEAEARRRFGEARVTVIRPGLISGPGDETDRFTYWPVRLAAAGPAGWAPQVLAPGDGRDPVMIIDARDLAEWTIRMAERRQAGTFNAIGPASPLPMSRFLAEVARGVRARPTLRWAPTPWLVEKQVNPWSDLPVWIPQDEDSAGFHRRSNRAAIAAGLTFRPVATTAQDTLTWFRTLPPERQARLRAGLTPEREARLLAELKA